MPEFLQAIEFTTSRLAEIEALARDWRGQADGGSVIHGTITACRDRPGTYLTIVGSSQAESATDHHPDPTAAEFIAEMTELCDEPPTCYTLEVRSIPRPRSHSGH